MTVRTRNLVTWMLGFVAVGLVFGGLSVEVITGSQVSRAQQALPGVLARAVPSSSAQAESAAAARQLAAARRHARARRFDKAAAALEVALADEPSAFLHRLAARVRLAAGDGMAAGRHAQLAARLAPKDKRLAAAADDALDLAMAWHLRPATRPLGGLGAVALLFLLAAAWRRSRERRRSECFLDNVSARLGLWADGEPVHHGAILPSNTESLIIDVFLRGRYGMACPRKPKRGPTLSLVWSNAGSSQTIRQRAIKNVHDSAVRVKVQPDTLRRVLDQPGAWRLHARLGDRPLVTLPVTVAPPLPERVLERGLERGRKRGRFPFRLVGS